MVTSVLVTAAACGRTSAPANPEIILATPDRAAAYVEVRGLSRDQIAALGGSRSPEQWTATLRVGVDESGPAMLGDYTIAGGAVRFTPLYPFDPGREYYVRFDPSTVPDGPGGPGGPGGPPMLAKVARPAEHTTPTTVVTRVYPTGEVVPENLLRMYVEFSAPMGRPSGIPFMTLLDEQGRTIEGAFLPLDYEFWSPDHKRFTAFFDPGRVKAGILPNQQMGRALNAGRTVTLVISREWRDEHGLPLKEEFRRTLRVGPAIATPLDTAAWRVDAPTAGGRTGMAVTFPAPLDHGLLMRALGVRRDGEPVEGEILVEDAETRWTFTPRDPWRAGAYQLIALDIVEDVAGNQIGRAFEVDNFDEVDKSPNPKTIAIPFTVTSR